MGIKDRRSPLPPSALARPPAPPTGSKIGPINLQRSGANVTPPQASGPGDNRTQMYTYITQLSSTGQAAILYNGDRTWAKVTLLLETAGPVAIGQQSGLYPVLGGQGVLLQTGTPYEVVIGKGTRLYIAANGVNRVSVKVEPYPWLEQLTGISTQIASKP